MMRSTGSGPADGDEVPGPDGKPVLLEVKASPIEYEGSRRSWRSVATSPNAPASKEQLRQAQKLEAVAN
jgi:hypothetical protein